MLTLTRPHGVPRLVGAFVSALLAFGLVVLSPTKAVAQTFCTGVPGTQYQLNIINWQLNDAARWIPPCSRANWGACVRADRLLHRADVGLDQILRRCAPRRDCRRGSLAGLLNRARRLAILSRQLQARSGMRRTYENSFLKIRGYAGLPLCGALPPPRPGRACRWQYWAGKRRCMCTFTNDPTVSKERPAAACRGLR